MNPKHAFGTLLVIALSAVLSAVLAHPHSSQNRRIKALVQTLNDTNAFVREQSEAELRRLGTNAVPVIIRMLQRPPPFLEVMRLKPAQYLRLPALKACMVLGPCAEKAAPPLAQLLLREPSVHVAMALAALGEGALPSVVGLLTHENEDTRYFSLLALQRIYKDHLAAQPTESAASHHFPPVAERLPAGTLDALVQNLTGYDTRLRAAAAWTLGALGQGAEKAVPALREALYDEEPMVRRQVEHALYRITHMSLPSPANSSDSSSVQEQIESRRHLSMP